MLIRSAAHIVPFVMLAILPPCIARADIAPADAERARDLIDAELPHVLALYKHLHTHPELSFQEAQTAKQLAAEMKSLGLEVTTGVGGHGVVALLRNGDGPTVMLRTDMDALPVIEQTGLDYASKVKVRDADENEVGVMHACGHDMHMACWVGAARVLSKMKDRWAGTVMFIAQPAEERGAGAKAMLQDGLFERFMKPNWAIAIHCDPFMPVGHVGFIAGPAMANVDSVDITVKGRGGHGAAPHAGIDPIVIAAKIVLDLQTIVSREVDPIDSAVVTVGSIHGGSKHNIIPDEVKLQITVRTFKDETREAVLKAIERKANAAAMSADAPAPQVKIDMNEYTPALSNHPELTAHTVKALRQVLGDRQLVPKPPVMGGEDFGRYGRAGVPICMLRVGTTDAVQFAQARAGEAKIPSLHSPLYYPVPEPTIRTGVLTLTTGVLNLLEKK